MLCTNFGSFFRCTYEYIGLDTQKDYTVNHITTVWNGVFIKLFSFLWYISDLNSMTVTHQKYFFIVLNKKFISILWTYIAIHITVEVTTDTGVLNKRNTGEIRCYLAVRFIN